MSMVTVIIQNAPYQPGNKAWNALRFAGAALADDMEVQVHLLEDGVQLGRRNHEVPEGAENLEELIAELIECGLVVRACGKSVDDYGISEDELITGVEKGSMKSLAGWVKESDNTIAF